MHRQKSQDSGCSYNVAASASQPESPPLPRVEVRSPDGLEERPMFDDDGQVRRALEMADFATY